MKTLFAGIFAVVLAASFLGANAWGDDSCPFRYNDGVPEFYDPYVGWSPTRIVTEDGQTIVQFESDGHGWFSTGYTADEMYACLGGASPDGCYFDHFRRDSSYTSAKYDSRAAAGRDWERVSSWRDVTIESGERYGMGWEQGCAEFSSMMGASSPDVPAREVPDWRVTWGASGAYRSDDFDIVGGAPGSAKTRTRLQSVNLTAVKDRFGVAATLTYARIDPDAAFGDIAYDELSLRVTPVAVLLEQAADGFDLDLITSFGVNHSWFEKDIPFDDPTEVFGAVGMGAGRWFSFGRLSLAYVYSLTKNTSGDNEVTGKGTLPIHTVSGTWTAPLARGLFLTLGVDWQHTNDLPSRYDADEYYGRAALSYRRGRWETKIGLDRSISSGNQREWTLTGGISYAW